MKTLSLSELIAALQNAQKEGIETVCVYQSSSDCGFNVSYCGFNVRAITSDIEIKAMGVLKEAVKELK